MIKQNKTQNRNETNPTISKFTWTVTSLATLFKGNNTSNDRALGCLKRWRGAAEPGSVQRWQCHLVHTTIHYYRLQSLNCVLRNQLACSIVILQLITWAVNSGQLCLKKKKKNPPPQNHTVLKISQQQLSDSQYPNNWTLRTKQRLKIYFPATLRGQCFGVNLVTFLSGMPPTSQQCPFRSFPFLLHQLASSLRGASNKE